MITIKASSFVMLGDVTKIQNKIKPSKNRFDCISSTADYEGFSPFSNKKGMVFLTLRENNTNFIAPKYSLQSQGLNFTGLLPTKKKNLFYGFPNSRDKLPNGKTNPTFIYRNDLYLFEVADDWKSFKVYIFPNQKPHLREIIDKFIKGLFDKKIEFLESKKKPLYNYLGL